jgi:LacI family transcriptional regulator
MVKVNIYDVAKAAGVHRSTVSRALTGSGPVSVEKKERVLAAAKLLNYHANSVAGALKSKRRTTWGFLSFWKGTPNSSDVYYAKSLAGLLDAAHVVGYRLLLQNVVGRFDQSEECIRFCHDAQLGGLVILAPRTQDLGELKRLSVPVVLLAHRPDDPDLNFVDLDNIQAAELAVGHLAGRGHTRIAYIGGNRTLNSNAQDRYTGYQKGLAAAGLPERAEWVRQSEFDPNFAEQAARDLLQDAAGRPSAIFCATDMMAAAVIGVAESLGLKVPKDLAVVGFDDNPDARFPGGLTTIRFPFFEAARRAGECLAKLSAEPDSGPHKILLRPELLVRASS